MTRRAKRGGSRQAEKDRVMCSEALLAGLAKLNLATPFRLEDLRCGDASTRIRVEDGVDDISTPRLMVRNSH